MQSDRVLLIPLSETFPSHDRQTQCASFRISHLVGSCVSNVLFIKSQILLFTVRGGNSENGSRARSLAARSPACSPCGGQVADIACRHCFHSTLQIFSPFAGSSTTPAFLPSREKSPSYNALWADDIRVILQDAIVNETCIKALACLERGLNLPTPCRGQFYIVFLCLRQCRNQLT